MISQEELKLRFTYDPNTGIFIRNITTSANARIGDVVGYPSGHGYLSVSINKIHYTLHRLAFLYMTGSIPNVVDHKDRNKANNIWTNLRGATQAQNCANATKSKNNTSGFNGVSFSKNSKTRPWLAQIVKNRKQIYIGLFETKEQAAYAYDKAALDLFGEYANLNFKEKEE